MKNAVTGLVVCLFSVTAVARDWNDDQMEVWSRLESCWSLFETGPQEQFAACYHPQYMGWYSADPLPMPFSLEVIDFYQKTTPRVQHTLQPREIIVQGDSAVVHYSALVVVDSDGKPVSGWENWTDMLIRESGVWRILGDHNHAVQTKE